MLLAKKTKEINISSLIFSIILVVFIFIFAITEISENFSLLQVITFLINGIVVGVMFVKGLIRHTFSIDLIHSVFCLLFLWIAPILQVSSHFNPWGFIIGESDTIKANIFILIWLLLYNMGAVFASDKQWKHSKINLTAISKRLIFILLGVSFLIAAFLLVKNDFNIEMISFSDSSNGSVAMLIRHSVMAFITFSTIICVKWFKANNYSNLFTILSVLCLVLLCFPTSLSRYAAGSIYICLIVNLFEWFKKRYRLTILILIGIIILFPVMDLYRYNNFAEVSFEKIVNQIFSLKDYFNTGNYDAYYMLMVTNSYVEQYGITFGRQLLGVILFFVPRSLWQSKPVSSGTYMAEVLNLTFDNISCPIMAEAYINFGVLGILLFAFFFGYILRMIDNTYWEGDKENFSFINLIYFYLLPYLFFICRGALMSTWAYLSANIITLYVLVKIIILKTTKTF